MKISELQTLTLYTDGKGHYRKIEEFIAPGTYYTIRPTAVDSIVVYVDCDAMGYEIGKQERCWNADFGKWAAECVEPCITPELALQAYKATNAIPIREDFIDNCDSTCFACAVGALYIWREDSHNPVCAEEFGESLLGRDYLNHFTHGFDDGEKGRNDGMYRKADERGKKAFEDGVQVWNAVKSLAEVDPQ